MSEKWYRQSGEKGDLVLSTRIRLARNLAHTPFPCHLTSKQKREVTDAVWESAKTLEEPKLHRMNPEDLPQREMLALVERHLVSTDFARDPAGCGLFLSPDEQVSIMVGEEDHVRIQVMRAGLDLKRAYDLADRIDTALDNRLHFAFDERLGFLTECPTNLGTGMRASLMLHLPALQESGAMRSIAGSVSKLGLTIRGSYGEGSQPEGALYQMSNQVTLGISEQAAMENLTGIASQIMHREQEARKALLSSATFEDKAWRSLGILRTARLLSHEEAIRLISTVMVGVSGGILPNPTLQTLTALISDIQPGCLMADAGEDMTPEVRDSRRAAMVRTALGEK